MGRTSPNIASSNDKTAGNQTGRLSSLSNDNAINTDVSLSDLWITILQRRWVVIVSIAVCVGLATLYCIVVSPRYTSTTSIVIDTSKSNTVSLPDLSGAMPSISDSETILNTAVQVLQSDVLALQVMDKLNLTNNRDFIRSLDNSSLNDPETRRVMLKQWGSDLTVKLAPKTNLIEVSFRTKSADLSTRILNLLSDDFVTWNFKIKFDSTMEASSWLEKQINDVKSETDAATQRLIDYQKKSGIIFWGKDSTNSVVTDRLDNEIKALSDAQSDRIMKEARYRAVISGKPDAIADLTPGTQSQLLLLRSQEADLKNQYVVASSQFGAAHPRVKQLKSEIGDVETAISAEIENVKQRLKEDYDASVSTENNIRSQMDAQVVELGKMNSGAIDLLELQREADASRELYLDLSTKLREAGVMAGLQSTNINVVDRAFPPSKPSDPKVAILIPASLLMGILIGVGLAFLIDNIDDTIREVDDAEKFSGFNLLGVIPSFSSDLKEGARQDGLTGKLVTLENPRSHSAEAYRTLRTALLLSRSDQPPKVLVITSPLENEGKSFTSMNLAVTLAQSNMRVLLIDADLRLGSLNGVLKKPRSPGLSNILAGAAKLEESVVAIESIPKLFFLPTGQVPPNPAELLGSRAMKQLLEHCSSEFDFVIIDAPPVLLVTDPVILGAIADSVVVVVRSRKTSRRALRRLSNTLYQSGIEVVGVVVNDVNFNSPGGSYYYGGKYSSYHSNYYRDEAGSSDK